jgi:hypothetical protein
MVTIHGSGLSNFKTKYIVVIRPINIGTVVESTEHFTEIKGMCRNAAITEISEKPDENVRCIYGSWQHSSTLKSPVLCNVYFKHIWWN